MAEVTQVEYRRLATLEGYNNVTIGATAHLADGDTPEAALAAIREWVDARIDEHASVVREAEESQTRLYNTRYALQEITRKFEDAKKRYDDIRAAFQSLGIELPPGIVRAFEDEDEQPF